MNKAEFLENLRAEGGDESLVSYYDELISDRIESGETEESVLSSLAVKKIVKEHEFTVAREELEIKAKEKRTTRGAIVVAALCAWPITMPLSIVFVALMFALAAITVAFLIAGTAGIVWGFAFIVEMIIAGESAQFILLQLGVALFALGVLGLIGCYGFRLLKTFYSWLVVKLFRTAQKKKEASK
jgi:uncharacterized membrane protein